MNFLFELISRRGGRDGLWDYLGRRAAWMGQVELEKARNEGAVQIINAIQGCSVMIRRSGPYGSLEIRAGRCCPAAERGSPGNFPSHPLCRRAGKVGGPRRGCVRGHIGGAHRRYGVPRRMRCDRYSF
jgi:hypothetical protein